MARIEEGHIKGKLGTLVGCTWKGRPYLRRKALRTSPPTKGETRNRYVFDLVNEWLKPVHEFVRLGFRNYSDSVWGINAASSLLHKTALHRDGFESFIDPSLAKLSHGTLGLPTDLVVILDGDQLLFYWSTELGPDKDPKDRIMMLAYNIEQGTAATETSGPHRFTGYASLPLKPIDPGTYHLYAAFIAPTAEKQSPSRYLGSVGIE